MDFRRYLPWILAAGLAGLVAYGPIRSSPGAADAQGAWRTVRNLTAALRTEDLEQLTALYALDADHRDLGQGRRVRGRAAVRAFLEEAYGRKVRGEVDVASLRLLTPDVAIAQLTLDRPGGRWPPYLAALLRHRGDQWRLMATWAGGNPDTREHGLPVK